MNKIIFSFILIMSFNLHASMDRCSIYWVYGELECSKKACYQTLNKGTLSESIVKLDKFHSPLHGLDIVTKIIILNKPAPNKYKAKVLKIAVVDEKHKYG